MNKLIENVKSHVTDMKSTMERFMNDEKFYEDCFRLFVEDNVFKELDDGIKSNEYNEIFSAAHTLKGVAGNLGLTGIFDAAGKITEQARKKENIDIEAQFEKIKKLREEEKNMLE